MERFDLASMIHNIVAELANADTAQRLSRGEKVSVLWDDSAQIKLAD